MFVVARLDIHLTSGKVFVFIVPLLLGGIFPVIPQAHGTLPAYFDDSLLANVPGTPTDTAWTPDGRILIPVKDGQLRVYTNGTLVPTPALDLSPVTCTENERGVSGVAVHPNFGVNHFVYVYYTFKKFGTCNLSDVDGPVNRLSRFVLSNDNKVDPAGEVVLADTPPLPTNMHNAGNLEFGSDGYLYVTVGDGGTGQSQDLGLLFGKILRITDSGGIPATNPFTGPGSTRCNTDGRASSGSPPGTRCQEVLAFGLRNPFRFAFDPNSPTSRFFINDVGEDTWEEVDDGRAGANYGWPEREGPCATGSIADCGPPPSGITNPVYWYGHNVTVNGNGCAAITGGAFVPKGVWPQAFEGSYLFADWGCGAIWKLTADSRGGFSQNEFASVDPGIVSIRFGPYGTTMALYYSTQASGGQVRRISFTGRDVGVTALALSSTVVYYKASLLPVRVNVTVANRGNNPESFTATVKANQTVIGTQTVTLTAGTTTTVTLNWDTNTLAVGLYLLSAQASILPGETDLSDNSLSGGTFLVKKTGDVDGNGVVDLDDVLLTVLAWGQYYNQAADINRDGKIDIDDVLLVFVNRK